jgi:fatty-acyl-CoA synthase
MDESGYISINGRIKDMVIRGGENIYPLEIEDFLLTHEEVTDAQVIRFKQFFTVYIHSKKKFCKIFILHKKVVGIPDDRLGEELVAFIKIKKNSNIDNDSLKSYCKGKVRIYIIAEYSELIFALLLKISHFKIPKNFEFVDDFPRTVTGKIEKYKLKKLAEEMYKK